MRGFTTCAIVILAALASLITETDGLPKLPKKIKGIAFTTGHDQDAYRKPAAEAAYVRLQQTGTEYIHLTAILGIQTIYSQTSFPVTKESTIIFAIRQARRYRFKIFFKPIVQTPNYFWRGFIPPSRRWFRNLYTPYILRMARIAQNEGVEIFSVGSELKATVKEKNEWELIIRQVRTIFKGHLTYVVNHNSYRDVTFWHSLDFISVSAYFELVGSLPNGKSPDLAYTKHLWQGKARELVQWRNNAGLWYKKILIAEIGSMSKGGGVSYLRPWNYDAVAPTDFYEQYKIYVGFFSAFMNAPWCLGIILWNWEPFPHAGTTMPTIQGYTPQNKPAVNVMKQYFKRIY